MVNTLATIIFQISEATPIIMLLIRVISDLKVNYHYISDLDEMFHTDYLN